MKRRRQLMPAVLEYVAEETSARDRRIADRFAAEDRDLDQVADLENRQRRSIKSAREVLEVCLSFLPGYEGLWRSFLVWMREPWSRDESVQHLRVFQRLFEASQHMMATCRTLCNRATAMGATLDRLDELEHAEKWFSERIADIKKGIESRLNPWQPADPERFARELKLAREGKTVSADEARTWFRRTES